MHKTPRCRSVYRQYTKIRRRKMWLYCTNFNISIITEFIQVNGWEW